MKSLLALALALALLACHRTDLGESVDCGEGTRVVVMNNAFCVYPGQQDHTCPEELPHPTWYAGAGFCSFEEYPPLPLLGEALRQLADVDGGADAGPFDGSTLPDVFEE